MPTHHPPVLSAPQPTRTFFDPFHSSSTGHQIHQCVLAGTKSWRDSRTTKLMHQLKDTSGGGGQKHISDLVGAGSENWRKDGRKDNGDWEAGAPGLREEGWQDIRGLMTRKSKKRSNEHIQTNTTDKAKKQRKEHNEEKEKEGTFALQTSFSKSLSFKDETEDARPKVKATSPKANTDSLSDPPPEPPQIFQGLTIYLNGSTAPLISDHKLKQIFAQHGGSASIALGRRTVTHIIIGTNGGGGLSSSKINKENTNVRGKSIRFVTAQWVLDSIEKGIRQPEGKYHPESLTRKLGGHGQASVKGIFSATTKK